MAPRIPSPSARQTRPAPVLIRLRALRLLLRASQFLRHRRRHRDRRRHPGLCIIQHSLRHRKAPDHQLSGDVQSWWNRGQHSATGNREYRHCVGRRPNQWRELHIHRPSSQPCWSELAFCAFKRGGTVGSSCTGFERDNERSFVGLYTPSQAIYTITVTNPITATSNFPANVSVTHTLSPITATIVAGGASRNVATGIVTITTSNSHGLNIGQSITIAGVTDPSFNGTFTIPGCSNSHHAYICSGGCCCYQRFRDSYRFAAL